MQNFLNVYLVCFHLQHVKSNNLNISQKKRTLTVKVNKYKNVNVQNKKVRHDLYDILFALD